MQLVALPNRRVEEWKYSDLRAALDAGALAPRVDAGDGAVEQARAQGGVIGALAAQIGRVEEIALRPGSEHLRIDRLSGDKLAPSLLRAEIGEGALLTRVVVQPETSGIVLDAAHVRVAKGGLFRQIVLSEGGKLARIETTVDVEGEGAHVALNGVYMAAKGRHADLTSTVNHRALSGETRQRIKGVARAGGRGVFQGKIVVMEGAAKTDARQHHQALLLEEGAEIFAKPELMIHVDDVACAHGNTVGALDEQALFYIRSRGVPEPIARALLTEAFLADAIPDDLDATLREDLLARISDWLAR
jgi:Fe-S cluster assembly protein SufD